jgi:hypothetical protein
LVFIESFYGPLECLGTLKLATCPFAGAHHPESYYLSCTPDIGFPVIRLSALLGGLLWTLVQEIGPSSGNLNKLDGEDLLPSLNETVVDHIRFRGKVPEHYT